MGNEQNLPTSQHFQLRKLSDGVYAAIQKPGGWAIGNAGIVDLGDHTLVFDTFLAPRAAAELRAAAETLTGRPVVTVINSHYHNEHFWGNQAFAPSTDIVATNTTRVLMATNGMQAIAQHQENAAKRLADLEQRYKATNKPAQRQQLLLCLGYYESIVATLPELQLRLPNVTFDGQMVLHGSQRSAEVFTYGAGHTPSDALLFLPSEGILFAGDLLSVQCHPYLADGDPGEISRILDNINQLKPKIIVPGHGELGDSQDVRAMAQYLTVLTETALIELAYKLESPAQLDEKIAGISIPQPFAGWLYANFFAANLRFLYERLMKAYAD